jgi:hypothetical protein
MLRCVLGLVVVVAACGDDGGSSKPIDAPNIDVPACTPSGTTQTLYLNFAGGTYMKGTPEDAVTNTSNALDMTRTLPAWSQANAAAIKTCMTTALADFNLDVVDVDPGTVAHHEIAFTTVHWSEPGISSLSNNGCGTPNPKSLAFVFGDPIGPDATAACENAVSQFASASTGLDHSMDCHDALGTYQTACGPKTFLDIGVQCGDFQAHVCTCTSQQVQNSFRRMVLIHGRRCP